jgi:hypothetical protein
MPLSEEVLFNRGNECAFFGNAEFLAAASVSVSDSADREEARKA